MIITCSRPRPIRRKFAILVLRLQRIMHVFSNANLNYV